MNVKVKMTLHDKKLTLQDKIFDTSGQNIQHFRTKNLRVVPKKNL